MDFAYLPEDEAFREELREWLDKALIAFEEREIPDVQGQNKLYAKRKAWQKVMAEGGWAAINWPKELGGREATLMQNVIYSQEMAKSKAPGIFNANGVWQIGPMIIRWGTQEQKDRWLHGILYADEHWCQGPRPVRTSRTCACSPPATATTTSSTARRSGSPPHTSRSGVCSSSAPTRRRWSAAPSTTASPR
jgi:hypothetical protein